MTEAEKLAFSALGMKAMGLGRRLLQKGTTSARGGALVGAGTGAALNVAREATSGKEDKNYLGALAHGAALGAATGAAAGHVGRTARDLKLGITARQGANVGKNLSGTALAGQTAREIGHQAKQFGQRQLYGFTGKGDPGKIGLQGKAWGAQKAKVLETRHADDLLKARSAGKPADQIAKMQTAHKKQLADVAESAASGQKRIDTGIDNIPGLVKGLGKKETRGKTWGALKEHGIGASTGAKMMSIGIPVGMTALDLSKGDESAQGGRTIGQKLVGGAVDLGTGIATGGMGALPSMAAFTAASSATDKLMGVKKPKPVQPEPAPQVQGAPRVQSAGVATPKVPTAGNPMRALS